MNNRVYIVFYSQDRILLPYGFRMQYTGFGGASNPGESKKQTAVRELLEELFNWKWDDINKCFVDSIVVVSPEEQKDSNNHRDWYDETLCEPVNLTLEDYSYLDEFQYAVMDVAETGYYINPESSGLNKVVSKGLKQIAMDTLLLNQSHVTDLTEPNTYVYFIDLVNLEDMLNMMYEY